MSFLNKNMIKSWKEIEPMVTYDLTVGGNHNYYLKTNSGKVLVSNSGKDEFINYLMARLTERWDWSWAVSNFEEPPEFHVTKMIEKFSGKAFMFRKNSSDRLTEQEKNYGIYKVDKYFNYINIDLIGATIDAILAKATELVKKKGINGLVINPWNCLEHSRPSHQSETEYTGLVLDKIVSFARKTNVHVFLIAHPTKIKKTDGKKYDIPTLYSISGSANFFNKTHNGLTVYRDFTSDSINQVTIYIQKVKWSWLGKIGQVDFMFNSNTRQYISL